MSEVYDLSAYLAKSLEKIDPLVMTKTHMYLIIDMNRQCSRLQSGIKEVWDSFYNGKEVIQRNYNMVAGRKHEKGDLY